MGSVKWHQPHPTFDLIDAYISIKSRTVLCIPTTKTTDYSVQGLEGDSGFVASGSKHLQAVQQRRGHQTGDNLLAQLHICR